MADNNRYSNNYRDNNRYRNRNRDDRDLMDRAGDEMRSWFDDDDVLDCFHKPVLEIPFPVA